MGVTGYQGSHYEIEWIMPDLLANVVLKDGIRVGRHLRDAAFLDKRGGFGEGVGQEGAARLDFVEGGEGYGFGGIKECADGGARVATIIERTKPSVFHASLSFEE